MKAPPFAEDDLRSIGTVLQDCATHSVLPGLFRECGLVEPAPPEGLSKKIRIFNAIVERQNKTQTGNFALKFIQIALRPSRFVNDPESHQRMREGINRLLAFRGLYLQPDGKFQTIEPATTINEAQARAHRLKAELERRSVHPDVIAFCREELLQENYFHAVLEATKSLSVKIRARTGLPGDAGSLSQEAFGLGKEGRPFLAFNSLATDTHKSEQAGLTNLFIGMFGTFRNVTAHGEKSAWAISEQDALDLLTLASLLHRRLDAAERTDRQKTV